MCPDFSEWIKASKFTVRIIRHKGTVLPKIHLVASSWASAGVVCDVTPAPNQAIQSNLIYWGLFILPTFLCRRIRLGLFWIAIGPVPSAARFCQLPAVHPSFFHIGTCHSCSLNPTLSLDSGSSCQSSFIFEGLLAFSCTHSSFPCCFWRVS